MRFFAVALFICLSGCGLYAGQLQTRGFFLVYSGHDLYGHHDTKGLYPVLQNIMTLSISSNGIVIYKSSDQKIILGRFEKELDGNIKITRIREIELSFFSENSKFTISDDGTTLFVYDNLQTKCMFKIFHINENKNLNELYQSEVDGEICFPIISPQNNKIVFYHRLKSPSEYSLICFDIEKQTLEEIAPVSRFINLSSNRTYKPRWNSSGEYIIFEGRYIDEISYIFSIIELKTKIIKSAPSFIWNDSKSLAYFDYEKGRFVYGVIDIRKIFIDKANSPPDKYNPEKKFYAPIDSFRGFEKIITIGDGAFFFQDRDKNFYYYYASTNELLKVATANFYASELFFIEAKSNL